MRFVCIVLVLMLSACNVSVQSFPGTPQPPAAASSAPPQATAPTTPTPAGINTALIESPALVKIQFLNELEGWGMTETQIARTKDGGLTWYNVTPPDLAEADTSVETFILDGEHAWVQKPDFNNYPNNGLMYRTSDGGLTWTISSTPFSGGDLTFLDVNNGWMLADLGVGAGSNAVAVFQTRDGGATWTQTYSNDPNTPDAGDSLPLSGLKSNLVPLNMQTAWVTGVIYASGTLYFYRSDDAGHTWSEVKPQLPAGAENAQMSVDRDQMKFVSPSDGFLAARMSTETGAYTTQTAVYVTNDGGNTWTLAPMLIPNAGASAFMSAQEAVIYNGEQFYVTRDGTHTWTTVAPNIVFGDSFASMDFVNPNTGWVITLDPNNHRSLYKTTDGGSTWSPVIP